MAGNQVDIVIKVLEKGVKSTFAKLVSDLKRGRLALDAFQMSIKKTNEVAGRLGGELKAMAAGVSVGIISQQLWEAGTQAQRLDLAFEAIAGSSNGAADELKFIRDEADRLGLVFYDTASAYKAIFAAGTAGNVELDVTRRIFTGFSESFAALGLNSEQVEGSLRAVGQMMGKNKVLAEELRTQLGDKLPVAIQYFADAAGVSVGEFEKMMANGEVGVEIIEKTANLLSKDFGPKAVEASKLAVGALAKWKTAWWDLKVAVSDSGFLDNATDYLTIITDTLKDPEVQRSIRQWSARFFELADAVIRTAWEYKTWIASILGAGAVLSILGSVSRAVVGIHAAFVVLEGMNLATWFYGLSANVLGLQVAIGGVTMSVGALAIAFGKAALGAAAFMAAYKVGEWLAMREHWAEIERLTKANARAQGELAAKFAEISTATGVTVTSMDELDAAVERGALHYDDMVGAWVRGSAEMRDAAASSMSEQSSITADELKEMEKAYKKYVDKIRNLQDQIAGRERSLAAELREMGRSGMSELSAWQDRKREAEEYFAAAEKALKMARQALSEGDEETAGFRFKEAQEYADAAKEAYKDLRGEVKDGDRVLISQQTALKSAMAGVESSGKLAIAVLREQKTAAQAAADELDRQSGGQLGTDHLKELESLTVDYQQAIKQSTKHWETQWEIVDARGKKVFQTIAGEIDRLNGRTIDVYVKYTEKRQLGGVIGAVGRRMGGMIGPAMMAMGGSVKNAMNGFFFPGYGGGDRWSNLVMAEDGEVMIKKESVRAAGLRAALAFNRGDWSTLLAELVRRFSPGTVIKKQLGGLISSVRPLPVQQMAGGGLFELAAASPTGAGNTYIVNASFPGNGKVEPLDRRQATNNARLLFAELRRLEDRRS